MNPSKDNSQFFSPTRKQIAEVHQNHEAAFKILQPLRLNNNQLKQIMDKLLVEMKRGLSKATHNEANVKCHVTYVTDVPDGSERGKYLALDLGGTNFRVLLIDLKASDDIEMFSKIYVVPKNLLTDTGEKLFDHIADCLADFCKIYKISEGQIGFTFSFPVQQLGLQSGKLMRWTKGFNCSGVVNENVVDLLNKSISKLTDVKLNTIALLNDTTGTLMSCALENLDCRIGLIVGTGTNVCYLEKASEAELFEAPDEKDQVIINCESGAFGENGTLDFIHTEYDKYIDENSINVGQQIFEKMTSGMYLGEMVRVIMLKMIEQNILFDGKSSDILSTRYSFPTQFISEIESDEPNKYTNCRRILQELRLNKYATDDDCENVRHICACISTRSAHLVSAKISTLINKINEKHTVVGVDGTVYRCHPNYHNLMVEKVKDLTNPGLSFEIMLSEDGSGKGAAVVTAVIAKQLLKENDEDIEASRSSSRKVHKNKVQILEHMQVLCLSNEQLKILMDKFLVEIKRGLSKATHNEANVKCHVTYVTDVPDGSERGKYLSLDLGGTNFRVLLIDLKASDDIEMFSKIYVVPTNLLTNTGEKLFDHIAECLLNFCKEYKISEGQIGFTFSFPVEQLGLQSGKLMRWTKGFNCSGVVNENVVDLLNKSISKLTDVKLNTIALLNDTTGTLMSCALENRNCRIGLIIGTGSNVCYLEKASEAELFEAPVGKDHVIINCESGAFGENGTLDFIHTEYDKYIDENSINVGQQIFEKMISGMYLGEMVRLVLLKLINLKLLFDGHCSDILEMRNSFPTEYLSEIESDEPNKYTNCRRILKELRLNKYATDDDCENVRYICACVSTRSAHLVSAEISALINKINESFTEVGVDGSVYRLHPNYHNLMVKKIKELINPGLSFDIMLSEDGSGKGAAVVAAVVGKNLN